MNELLICICNNRYIHYSTLLNFGSSRIWRSLNIVPKFQQDFNSSPSEKSDDYTEKSRVMSKYPDTRYRRTFP